MCVPHPQMPTIPAGDDVDEEEDSMPLGKYYVRGDGTVGKFGVPSSEDDLSEKSPSAWESEDEYEELRQDLLMGEVMDYPGCESYPRVSE